MLFTADDGTVGDESVMRHFHPDLPIYELQQVMRRLHKLKLTREETCLFMALQLLFTGKLDEFI
jgi:hypothetical protein